MLFIYKVSCYKNKKIYKWYTKDDIEHIDINNITVHTMYNIRYSDIPLRLSTFFITYYIESRICLNVNYELFYILFNNHS